MLHGRSGLGRRQCEAGRGEARRRDRERDRAGPRARAHDRQGPALMEVARGARVGIHRGEVAAAGARQRAAGIGGKSRNGRHREDEDDGQACSKSNGYYCLSYFSI